MADSKLLYPQLDSAASESKRKEGLCEVTVTRKPVTGDSVAPVSPAISRAAANGREKQIIETNASKSCNQSGNGSTKPNCYECKHRRELVGDCHSSCVHPGASPIAILLFAAGQCEMQTKHIHVRGNAHGVRSGWFMWPMNFDPVWLDICSGFEAKHSKE